MAIINQLLYNRKQRGDTVKLKHYHIFLFAGVCFFIAFIGINNKYDRFYRVAGMNNESRILIETYMDEAQQNYMVENNVGVFEFIRYITYHGFQIQNYEYYNSVEQSGTYPSLQEVVTQTNEIVNRLRADTPWSVSENLSVLIQAKLLKDYVNNANFNLKHITIYEKLKPFYMMDDYSYLALVENNLESLNKLGYQSIEACTTVLVNLFEYYTPNQVERLISASITAKEVLFLEEPTALDAILKGKMTVDSYVPDDLTLIEDLPRYTYFLYLREEAYNALKEMCQAYEHSTDFVPYYILSAYRSYESILVENEQQAGHLEEQLGMTVSFQVTNLAVEDFVNSSFFTWLQNNAYQYGYILRYPENQSEETLRDYNAYTYRYVGKEIAKEMRDQQYKTLEEYVSKKK